MNGATIERNDMPRTDAEAESYLDGMLAGALRVRIKTEGEFRGDVRAAEEWVKRLVAMMRSIDPH